MLAANFVNYFTPIDQNRETNNKCSIRLPSMKLESTRNSFFLSGAYVYNELPWELPSEANFNNFINLLNKYEFV